jgi:hypothetical protein
LSSQVRNDLYLVHAAPNTVQEGSLRTDLAPGQLARAARIMFDKRSIVPKKLPMKLDLARYRSPDFRYDTSSAQDVLRHLQGVPLNREGMRWIHLGDHQMFYGVVDLDVPFDEFVRRVDVSRVGDCFRDVLGITTEVLQRDSSGRPLCQVERISALAQPNYSAFLGKDELDTYKLEWIEYTPDEVRNWMRTVCSPNGSTRKDDGYMSFIRLPEGTGTRIEFVAHQSFPMPRITVLLGLEYLPPYKRFLAECAYRRFWRETVRNILARYEGRRFGIGDQYGATP